MEYEDMTKTCNHTSIHCTHPRSLKNINKVYSGEHSFKMNNSPTKRYLKKLELNFISCPDCESGKVIFNGSSAKGTQRFKCKACNYQFVAQYDAIFPRSKRRAIFEKELLENIKPTTFGEVGTGRQCYHLGAILKTLQMLESRMIRLWVNKMIKASPIKSEQDYRVMLEFLVHQAYSNATA